MSKNFYCLLLLFILFFNSLTAYADQITLKNGDRLTGKIVDLNDGSITLETEYAGVIKIDAKDVKAVILPGAVAEKHIETAKAAVVNAKKEIKVENPADLVADAPVKKSTANKPDSLKPLPRLFGGRFMGIADGWEGNANIGFSYTSGNTQTSTMTTSIRAVKTGHRDNLTVYLRSLWNSNRKIVNYRTTSNAVWGGARYDRNINEKLFSFVSYDFERDRPKKLNFRSVVGGGLGSHTVKSDRTEWDILIGGAWNRAWQVGDNASTAEALVGSSFKHKFGDRLKFQKTFTFYQDVAGIGKYRFIFDTTISADVTKRIGWFVTIGDRFNSYPIGNVEKNDVLFTTGMKWNFGKKK